MADLAVQNNTPIQRGEMATGEIATRNGAAMLEPYKVHHEESTEDEAEGIQQVAITNLGAHNPQTAIHPIVDSLGTTTGANAVLSNASCAPTAARDAVMGTPELLEAIISFLPVQHIFAKAQRVSQTWNAVTRSPSIRTRLWLRSSMNEVASPIDFPATPFENVQPLEHFLSYMPVYSGSIAHNLIAGDFAYVGYIPDEGESPFRSAPLVIPGMMPGISSDNMQPTWLNMYLTEPRITTAQLNIQARSWGFQSVYDGVWASVQDSDGLTFGTVLAVVQKVYDGLQVDLAIRDEAEVVVWFLTER